MDLITRESDMVVPKEEETVKVLISDIDRCNCYSRMDVAKVIKAITEMDMAKAFEVAKGGSASLPKSQALEIRDALSGIAVVRVIVPFKSRKLKITKSVSSNNAPFDAPDYAREEDELFDNRLCEDLEKMREMLEGFEDRDSDSGRF